MGLDKRLQKTGQEFRYRMRRFGNERIGGMVPQDLRLGGLDFWHDGATASLVKDTDNGGRLVQVSEQIGRTAGRMITRTTSIDVTPPGHDYGEIENIHTIRAHQTTDRFGLHDAEWLDYTFGGSDWDPTAENSLGLVEMHRVVRMIERAQTQAYNMTQPDLRRQSV